MIQRPRKRFGELCCFAIISFSLSQAISARECTAVIDQADSEAEVRGVITDPSQSQGPVLAKIKAGERFIAVEGQPGDETWSVYLQSGVFGWMRPEKIRLLRNEPLPKLTFRREDVLQWATGEPAEALHQNADYGRIVTRAMTGNAKALTVFFQCGRFMDGAAAEAHDEITWAVFHLVGDVAFSRFVRDAPSQSREVVKDYLTSPNVTYPISQPIPYINVIFRRHTV
jgi:hypothetical protein